MGFREWKDIARRFASRGVYPHQIAFLLEVPLRYPAQLADRLNLSPDSRVLEAGPGPGYSSVEVARRIPAGRLELLDIQPEMLDMARRKIRRAGLNNVGYTEGDASELRFPAKHFDVAFLVDVLGEVHDRAACLCAIA